MHTPTPSVIAEQAAAFVRGDVSSVAAFRAIDRAIFSWPTSITLNEAHAMFDREVDALIDRQVSASAK